MSHPVALSGLPVDTQYPILYGQELYFEGMVDIYPPLESMIFDLNVTVRCYCKTGISHPWAQFLNEFLLS